MVLLWIEICGLVERVVLIMGRHCQRCQRVQLMNALSLTLLQDINWLFGGSAHWTFCVKIALYAFEPYCCAK